MSVTARLPLLIALVLAQGLVATDAVAQRAPDQAAPGAPAPTIRDDGNAPDRVRLQDGAIVMRVPRGWVLKQQSDGRNAIVEPGRGRWTLVLDWDQYDLAPDRPRPENVALMTQRLKAQMIAEHGGTVESRNRAGGELLLVHDYVADELSGPNRVRSWHRIVSRGTVVVLAHFSFLSRERLWAQPDIAAARDLVESEALAAALAPWSARPTP